MARLKRILLWLFLLPYALAIPYFLIPPPSTLMIARLLTLQKVEREWVPLSRISPNLIAAVVSSEDGAFCEHHGIDFHQMEKSVTSAATRNKKLNGSSTITMQTAKNIFLWSGRSWIRKILEAPLALWLELIWPKKRILEVYLNVAEWGDGIYGAQAAAQHHFGVSANALTLRQASLLAASLPNPIKRVAGRPNGYTQAVASNIEYRVNHSGPPLGCVR